MASLLCVEIENVTNVYYTLLKDKPSVEVVDEKMHDFLRGKHIYDYHTAIDKGGDLLYVINCTMHMHRLVLKIKCRCCLVLDLMDFLHPLNIA